jgi:predicted NBD/HSP70 family sugar kinase
MADNDATVAAIGESLFGIGRRCANFAYLHLTNGFGGGIIADGKPFRGHNGNAGEFGAVWNLTADAYPNLDFLKTCVEAEGAGFATVEEMVRVIDTTWPGVDHWLEVATPPFALLIGILNATIDPQMIAIGGRLPRSIAQALVERIILPTQPKRRGRSLPPPKVVVAEARGEAVSLGAAVMPLQRAFFV